MKHFVNIKTRTVYGYESLEDAKTFNDDFDNLVEMAIEEAKLIANPPLSQEELDQEQKDGNFAFLALESDRVENAISKLKRAVDRKVATEEELNNLDELEIYSIELMRVPSQLGWALNPVWPVCPVFFKI